MSKFAMAAAIAVAVGVWWCAEAWMHQRRMRDLTWIVHVNGIRGKSTVTRMIAGAFREAGIRTIGKSTGTAAAVIDLDGNDRPIIRKGPPTILEQIRVARRHVDGKAQALIVECMALKPAYQRASERHIVRSNIGVLTNVRHDHQDVMGESLSEIAAALLETCPRNGVLVTAEQNPDILEIIRRAAVRNRSQVIVADPGSVTDAELARFQFVSFKENVAIALTVAGLAGIDRETALNGIVGARPDPGVLRVSDCTIGDTTVTWANLFAVNDRESMIAAMERLEQYRRPETVTVGILNNRADREQRAMQFADIAVNDLRFDRLVTFGADQRRVTKRIVELGFDAGSVINLDVAGEPSIDDMIAKIVASHGAKHVLLVGMVNIHTAQAGALIRFLESRTTSAATQNPAVRQQPDLGPLTDALVRGDGNRSRQLADGIGYELLRGTDVDNREFVMARERVDSNVRRRWGTLIIADQGEPVVVEVRNTIPELDNEQTGLRLFRGLTARALVVAGSAEDAFVNACTYPTNRPAVSDVVVSSARTTPSAVSIDLSQRTSTAIGLATGGLSTDILRRIDLADGAAREPALAAR